jgi:large subunit ribosomal protein L30
MGAKKTGSKNQASLTVRQLRSGIGFRVDQKATLYALGLGRIGRVSVIPDNPQTRGMVAKVSHLVAVESGAAGEER